MYILAHDGIYSSYVSLRITLAILSIRIRPMGRRDLISHDSNTMFPTKSSIFAQCTVIYYVCHGTSTY